MRTIAVLVVIPAGAAATALSTHGTTAASFSAQITNPWFPLVPGTTFVYAGLKDGKPSREVLTVTHTIRIIRGTPCLEVHDSGIYNTASPQLGRSFRQEYLKGKAEDHFAVIGVFGHTTPS
jgi:hypothetical protein